MITQQKIKKIILITKITPVTTPSVEPDNTPTESDRIAAVEQEGRDRVLSNNNNERSLHKNRVQNKHNDYAYLFNDSAMKIHEA